MMKPNNTLLIKTDRNPGNFDICWVATNLKLHLVRPSVITNVLIIKYCSVIVISSIMKKAVVFAYVVLIYFVYSSQSARFDRFDLSDEYIQQILRSQDDVNRIIPYLLEGGGAGKAYQELADTVDKSGARVAGSAELEKAIDDMKILLENEFGAGNVSTENATFPKWTRGFEQATMLTPRPADIYLTSLFLSPPGDVTAEAVVVRTFDELDALGTQVAGKIVVYYNDWISYGYSYEYRNSGASRASAYGAVGALIRSATGFSIHSPHTGAQEWAEGVTPIPSACITVEDAEMFYRMYQRGNNITIRIQMGHEVVFGTTATSRNLIVDIPGVRFPDQYVIFGCHFDSWDAGGVGAMDDAGGCMVMKQILSTIKALNLQPWRTMRLVLWTAEELGLYGGDQYFDRHRAELLNNISVVLESDMGTFAPLGLGVHNMSGLAQAIIEEILTTYLAPYGMGNVYQGGGGTADISKWIENGVPGLGLITQNDEYFNFHHTGADRMLLFNSTDLDRNAALVTVATYVIGNMDALLPREGDYPIGTTVAA